MAGKAKVIMPEVDHVTAVLSKIYKLIHYDVDFIKAKIAIHEKTYGEFLVVLKFCNDSLKKSVIEECKTTPDEIDNFKALRKSVYKQMVELNFISPSDSNRLTRYSKAMISLDENQRRRIVFEKIDDWDDQKLLQEAGDILNLTVIPKKPPRKKKKGGK